MNGRALYNEIEAFSAGRIRARIAAGLVCPGDVDERDVRDVLPAELDGYSQIHLFAGGGAWSYALRLAGWPDWRNVWTLSCPCQPFSAAGRRGGVADERHLWPSAFHLIDVHRPDAIFGEQVASKDGLAWLDLVRADLEGAGYAVRVQDTCSAGVGAPNIRQRLYFGAERLALSDRYGRHQGWSCIATAWHDGLVGNSAVGRLAGADSRQRGGWTDPASGHDGRGQDAGRSQGDGGVASCGGDGGMARSGGPGSGWHAGTVSRAEAQGDRERRLARRQPDEPDEPVADGADGRPGPVNGFWRDADWVLCRDEPVHRWRPVESRSFPLVARPATKMGRAERVGRIREHGNAINVRVAAGFIADCLAEGL